MEAKIKNLKNRFSDIINNKTVRLVGVLLLIFILGYLFWPVSKTSKQNGMMDGQGIFVSVISLKKEPIHLQTLLPGRLVPYQIAEIRPQVTGIISQRFFEEGSQVKEGDKLYQIDDALYQAAYHKAEADVMKAQANFDLLQLKANRVKELIKVKALSKQDYDDIMAQLAQAKAEVGIAKAALETVKINLDYTTVHAPISGRIGKSEVTKGALVTANQASALARITQLDPIYIDMTQSSTQLIPMDEAALDKNHVPVVLFLGNDAKPYAQEGKLEFTDVTVDESTGTVMLRAIFPNPEQILLPGLFVRAAIKSASETGILVPQKAVIRNSEGSASVWVVDKQNKVQPKLVTLGQAIGDKWLLKEGLKEGDVVVTEGFQKLMPGAVVKASH